jgi:hypothetical protein
MSNIPTAEEILEKNVEAHRIASKIDPTNIGRVKEEVFHKSMIEFAKLHVEAALDAAANEYYPKDKENFELVTERFINAYPLTNIK